MNGKMQKILILMMALFGGLFVVANLNFITMEIDLSNWIEYVLLLLFFVLLLQFWRTAQRMHLEEVKRVSITDSLSQLYNSQHFFELLEGEIDRSRRRHHALSSIYFDIDYFHRYNESHGIKAGDRVLKYLGKMLSSTTRKYDTGFRFGNDEFALILPETDRMQSRIIAERIRESFYSRYGGEIALSIGVATLEDQDNVDRIVRKIETAMEEARRGGGNRIRAYIERGQM